MRKITRLLSALCLSLAPVPAGADAVDRGTFDIYLRGIRAGYLAFSAVENGASYSASGRLESTGLVAIIRKVRFDAKSRGIINGDRYIPQKYEENSDIGRRQAESIMDYVNGVPQIKVFNPPRPPGPQTVDPATQGGTVDPMTAIYALLRDISSDRVCQFETLIFDGKRQTQVVLQDPVRRDGQVICTGEYRRLQGFSPHEMAEKQRFPFRLTYVPIENGMMRAARIRMETNFGLGTLIRR